jgi:hypothetical protein
MTKGENILLRGEYSCRSSNILKLQLINILEGKSYFSVVDAKGGDVLGTKA